MGYDCLIDWIEFYAVSAIFKPCNGGHDDEYEYDNDDEKDDDDDYDDDDNDDDDDDDDNDDDIKLPFTCNEKCFVQLLRVITSKTTNIITATTTAQITAIL